MLIMLTFTYWVEPSWKTAVSTRNMWALKPGVLALVTVLNLLKFRLLRPPIVLFHQLSLKINLCMNFPACADAYLTPCIKRYIKSFSSGFKDIHVSCVSISIIKFVLFQVILKLDIKGIIGISSRTLLAVVCLSEISSCMEYDCAMSIQNYTLYAQVAEENVINYNYRVRLILLWQSCTHLFLLALYHCKVHSRQMLLISHHMKKWITADNIKIGWQNVWIFTSYNNTDSGLSV